MDIKVGYHTDN